MNLQIENRLFIVTGASDGLGLAVTENLLKEKARVIAVSRSKRILETLAKQYPDQLEIITGDLFSTEFANEILKVVASRRLQGIFVNAGGPPAKTFLQTTIEDWDEAYRSLLRWKVNLIQLLLPNFLAGEYGRIIFSESVSVKQPLPELVLSNSLRSAVTSMAKTLSLEVAKKNISINVIATGYHDTHAMQRLFKNKMENENMTMSEARSDFEKRIPAGKMGDPDDFGRFITWMMSPLSGYITGQTIAIDGGVVRGIFG